MLTPFEAYLKIRELGPLLAAKPENNYLFDIIFSSEETIEWVRNLWNMSHFSLYVQNLFYAHDRR